MHLKSTPTNRLPPILIVVLIVLPMLAVQASGLQLTTTSEYNRYVNTYVNSEKGNYTLVEKPIFPIMINNSQIQVGQNWTIICPLQAGHNYHVYCYGNWVNTSAAAKTDYDIYVFDPDGTLESSHTEAAGLPEHLGTTANDALFSPAKTGNYSFVLKNDVRESKGAQQATFMIIENLESDRWYTCPVEGKDNQNQPGYHTVWAYEFVTNASKVEVYIKVPRTLDMYEARLYLMNNVKSPSINDFPLPCEPGLYGNISGSVGGYNFENEAYRGVYASCEHMGQTMFLNYTSPNTGLNLYHLVLIGEEGSGEVEFMLKSRFGEASLDSVQTPKRVYPNAEQYIEYASNNANLQNATLSYTINGWVNSTKVEMAISNKTCSSAIPGQAAGTKVQYHIDAKDVQENEMSATDEYFVKQQVSLSIEAASRNITIGGNITINGVLTPYVNNATVVVQFFSANATESINCKALSDGSFTASFQPTESGPWSVAAYLLETQTCWRADSQQLLVTVNEPPLYVQYGIHIIIGLVVACAVSGAVWFLKFRNR